MPFIVPAFQGAQGKRAAQVFQPHFTKEWLGREKQLLQCSVILKPKQFPRFGNVRKLALAGFTFQDKLLSKFCVDPEIICHGRALSHPGENPKASIFLPTLNYIYLDIAQQEAPPHPTPLPHTDTTLSFTGPQLFRKGPSPSQQRGPGLEGWLHA